LRQGDAIERILRADDPRIAAYRDVRDPELVRSRGLFIAEGRLVVRRVLADGRYRVQSVLVNDAAYRDLAALLDRTNLCAPVYVCATGDFLAITGYNIHRGCLALVERPAAESLDEVIASTRRLVVLDGVTNADNVGAAFRNAAAFGSSGVLLSPTSCDPLYRKAIRTSMGAVLSVPFTRAGDWPADLSLVRAAGFTIVALTPHEPSETLQAFATQPRPSRLAIVAGTEGTGLTPAVESTADARVRIPISDAVDSLNVAMAIGIALYALDDSHQSPVVSHQSRFDG
jgi:tRNA G18 (ribose-2'-O)-methylase SpoU